MAPHIPSKGSWLLRPVSAAGISTGLPAEAGMQMKKAFAGDRPCDAEAALIEDQK